MVGRGQKISWARSPLVFLPRVPRIALAAHDLTRSPPSESLEQANPKRKKECLANCFQSKICETLQVFIYTEW